VPDRLPLTLTSYRLLARAATPLAPCLLGHRLRRGKEDPERVSERSGKSAVARPEGPLIWVHGASVGELVAAFPLIEQILARDFGVIVTSGTVASAALAAARLPAGVVHQFVPLDSPIFIGRFLDHWRPNLALFVESDLWPNMVISSFQRRIPMILINGRLSERSFNRWRYLPGTIEALLQRFDLCLVRSVEDAERFGTLGALRITTTGNLKLDAPALDVDENKLSRLRHAVAGRTVIAAASTHPGEEAAIIDAHRRLKNGFPGLLTLIAPRHPERGAEIVDLAKRAGLMAVLRSRGHVPLRNTDLYVCDTIGELGLVYRLAPIVFMGGSLVTHGGQNPIEPIKLGAAVLHGPHVSNFTEIYSALGEARGAELVADPGALTLRIAALLKDPEERHRLVGAAQTTVQLMGGALDRTLAALEPYFLQIRLENPPLDA
jgi:3-deoxy-D-manno-octulosonic-acid transferase